MRRIIDRIWYALLQAQEQVAYTQYYSWGAIGREEYLEKMDEIDERYRRIREINNNKSTRNK